jgi:hypothetical protein
MIFAGSQSNQIFINVFFLGLPIGTKWKSTKKKKKKEKKKKKKKRGEKKELTNLFYVDV